MINFDLYMLLTGASTGGTWTQVGTTPQVISPMPAVGAVPANINIEGILPGTYTFTYQAPNTCGSPPPSVTATLIIKDTPISDIPTGPLYFCAKNGAAPASQVIVNTPKKKSSPGTNWNEGTDGTLGYNWFIGATGIGTGNNFNFVPPGPYTSLQSSIVLKGNAFTTNGSPVCVTDDTLQFNVSPNINDGMATNTLWCQGNASAYNVNTVNIMGASAPVVSGNGIRREIKVVSISSGATTIPKISGGTVAVGSWLNWDEFNQLNLSGFANAVVITYQYKMFYQFPTPGPANACEYISGNFTTTITAAGSSGTGGSATYCNG